LGKGLLLLAGVGGGIGSAYALALPDGLNQEIQELRQQLAALSKRLDQLTSNQPGPAPNQTPSSAQHVDATAPATRATAYAEAPAAASSTAAEASAPSWSSGMPSRVREFLTAIGNMELYGDLNLSVDSPLAFVYQLETQIDVSATAGAANSNAAQDSTVKGALTSRNSFIGLAAPSWGALKIGKDGCALQDVDTAHESVLRHTGRVHKRRRTTLKH
jgi:hypothetical protein